MSTRVGPFVFRHSPIGFGWEVVNHEDGYRRQYLTSDRLQLNRLRAYVEAGGSIDEFPETPQKEFEPMLMIVRGKHITSYALIHDEDELFSVSLEIVRDRNERGVYDYMEVEYKPLSYSEDDIELIPVEFRPQAVARLENHVEYKRHIERNREQVRLLAAALSGSGYAAWRFLRNQDHDDESIVMERFMNIKPEE